MSATLNSPAWLELQQRAGEVASWVLYEQGERGSTAIASMPAPPRLGRTAQQLADDDGVQWWVADQLGAMKIWLNQDSRHDHPVWNVVARRIVGDARLNNV